MKKEYGPLGLKRYVCLYLSHHCSEQQNSNLKLETIEILIFYMMSKGMLKLLTWNNLVEENKELEAY